MKIVINACHGGFSLSSEAQAWIRAKDPALPLPADDFGAGRDLPRDNAHLVACVEALGGGANGPYARLKVVEIPDGVEWQIEEYDGMEWIAEKHRTWE